MIHLYLRTQEDWDIYLGLLVSFEGHEAEFNARAALLIQSCLDDGLTHEDAVRRGLIEADRVERALLREAAAAPRAAGAVDVAVSPRRAPQTGPRWRSEWYAPRRIAMLGGAAAAGLALGLLVPEVTNRRTNAADGLTYRGAAVVEGGSVKIWGEALLDAVPRQRIGRGNTPILRYRPGDLSLHWSRPPAAEGISAVAYWVDQTGARHGLAGEAVGYTVLDDVVKASIPAGVAILVIITFQATDDVTMLITEAGDGQRVVADTGSWQMLAMRLVEVAP